MNKYSTEYKFYQLILESNITDQQRQALLEANVLQRFKDWFGAAGDWINSPLGSLFSDAKLGRRMQTSISNVKKEIGQLKDLAKEAKKNEKEIIAAFINGVLSTEGLTSADLQKAKASGSKEGEKKGSVEASAEEIPAGTKINPSNKELVLQALVQILSDITNKPAEKVADEANEKKVDIKGFINIISKQAGQVTNIPAEAVSKVMTILFEKGHIQMDG